MHRKKSIERSRCLKTIILATEKDISTYSDPSSSGGRTKTSIVNQRVNLNDNNKKRKYNHSPCCSAIKYPQTNQESTTESYDKTKNVAGTSKFCPYTEKDILYMESTFTIKENFKETEGVDDDSQSKSIDCDQGDEENEKDTLSLQNPEIIEFDILDEVSRSDEEEGEHQLYDSSEKESEIEQDEQQLYDLSDNESKKEECEQQLCNSSVEESGEEEEVVMGDVDAMLEEDLPDKLKHLGKDYPSKLNQKTILEEIGHNSFDQLPEGWIKIMHNSGMPQYLHKQSRVCTMTRPYYLGPGSSRIQKIPLNAIPCLQYRRGLEREKNKTGMVAAKIESYEEYEASQSLEAADLQEYCKRLFNFKTVMSFKSRKDWKQYVKMTKELKRRQTPLPSGIKLIKIPIQDSDGSTNSKSNGEWIINPNGKSHVCILHEYGQNVIKKQPKYEFKIIKNSDTPYLAKVSIEDIEYGVGMGAKKKEAKMEAAKAALAILIPELNNIEHDSPYSQHSMFDQIKMDDPRIAELCVKAAEPLPYSLLVNCISINLGTEDVKVKYTKNSKHMENQYMMEVGKHKVTVACRNKREGKQRAAQAILRALHPNISHWGALLRMYGNRSVQKAKERKREENKITCLQRKGLHTEPNFAILEKLKSEMLKLKKEREAREAKGKFIPPENVILPSLSSADLNKVNFS